MSSKAVAKSDPTLADAAKTAMMDMIEKANRIEGDRDVAYEQRDQAIRELEAAQEEIDSLKDTIRIIKTDHARELDLLHLEIDVLRKSAEYERRRADHYHGEHTRISHTLDTVAAAFSDEIQRAQDTLPPAATIKAVA